MGYLLLLTFGKWLIGQIYAKYLSENPNWQIDGLIVVGNKTTATQVSHALDHLKASDLTGYQLVRRYLKAVVAVEKPIWQGFMAGVHFQSVWPDGSMPWQENRYGAVLIRSAVHKRIYAALGAWSYIRSIERCKIVALLRELKAMLLLGCNNAYVSEQRHYLLETASRCGQEYTERVIARIDRIEQASK